MNKSKLLWATLGVVLVAGLVWVIATAPKSQAPQSPSEVASPSGSETAPVPNPVGGTTGGVPKSIFLVAPLGGETWLIGQSHTISWTNAAQITGEIALLQAGTKTVVGWINSSTGMTQTSYAWDTKSVSTLRSGGLRKDVVPGNYLIRVKFDSARYPILTSGQIALTAMPLPIAGKSVSIQGFAFSPANITIARGGKVTFTNNDSVAHNITFNTTIYPASPLNPGASVTIDTSKFPPGTYNYYCSIHRSMTGTITVQ